MIQRASGISGAQERGGSGSAGGYTTTIPYEVVCYKTTSLASADKYTVSPTIFRGQLGTVPAEAAEIVCGCATQGVCALLQTATGQSLRT